MKKMFSLALALIMALALCVPAMAAQGSEDDKTTGSITVENTVKDDSYDLYRIFALESFKNDVDGQADAYAYKVIDDPASENDWAAFAKAQTDYVTVDAQGYVTWVEDASAADFAAAAIAYAHANKIGADATKTAQSDNERIVFDTLPLGYYLVESSVGALCALDTTDPDATVIEKNAKHTMDKAVKGDDDSWMDAATAEIGAVKEFQLTIDIEGIAKELVVHDKMTDGLTFNNDVAVKLNDEPVDAGMYEVSKTSAAYTFEVIFTDAFCATLDADDTIVVTYSATVNESALNVDFENNTASLTYKDNSGKEHETPDTKVYVYDFDILIDKYAGVANDTNITDNERLANAKFVLMNAEETKYYKWNETEEKVEWVDALGDATEVTTDAKGAATFQGLEVGTYKLVETEAPDGYNKLAGPVTVTISAEYNDDGTMKKTDAVSTEDGQYIQTEAIENNTGVKLPATGGMGTTIFYTVGGVMMAAAVVLFVTKKKLAVQE